MKGIKKKIAYKINEWYCLGLDKHEKTIINSVLASKDFGEIINNKRPHKIEKIAFLMPGIDRYSGGVTSILRLGTYLCEFGIEVDYIDIFNSSIKELDSNAKINLNEYQGNIALLKDSDKEKYDVVIAGNWQAVYSLNEFDSYKVYFVQDFEPYFFKLNERYLLAKLAYEIGFHIISLGKWNIDVIKRECKTSSVLDYISFPYEPREYLKPLVRNYSIYKEKKSFKIAVYTKEEGKRIPNILQYIIKNASEELIKHGIKLDVNFFGLKRSYQTSIGHNMGKLNKEELLRLYEESDFGMVASMTNISLVPYEMIATGLPVIEFKEGSFPAFFSEDAAIMIDFNYMTFVDSFLKCISEPLLIKNRVEKAYSEISKLSWNNTAQEFMDILNNCILAE